MVRQAHHERLSRKVYSINNTRRFYDTLSHPIGSYRVCHPTDRL
ncbi:hypothetical protein [Moraxella lacunata]|nr:hypothetical protein [Moraxella lacunata]